ncbi:MAG: tyrosine--tRNA ligase [Patescibacteria group bacterium]|nr:tyrosine--tRNA ligase [Patescibacteria group bacterium]
MTLREKEKIKEILLRGVEEIIDQESLKKRLLAGEKLRVKLGIDPTTPYLHLGNSVALLKLRDFQELGHQIIFILGDFTAQIGDPSDKLQKRPFLSFEEVRKNVKNYQPQVGKILEIDKVEWHYNSEWLSKLNFQDISRLAEIFTVRQMLTRRGFRERYQRGEEISLREFLYPLMQGYDSVAVKADLEIGGTDQLFNLKAGREIQKFYGQKPQEIMTLQMLEGLDGEKMSKTRKNIINLLDPPNEQFGKIMSMRDELIIKYFTLCTRRPLREINEIAEEIKRGSNPRDFKAKLAKEIVKMYHGAEAAQKAEKEFNRIFREKKLPSEVPTYKLKVKKLKLIDLLVETKLVSSKSEARRLVEQGAVKINGQVEKDWQKNIQIKRCTIIKVGKRRFIKLDIIE